VSDEQVGTVFPEIPNNLHKQVVVAQWIPLKKAMVHEVAYHQGGIQKAGIGRNFDQHIPKVSDIITIIVMDVERAVAYNVAIPKLKKVPNIIDIPAKVKVDERIVGVALGFSQNRCHPNGEEKSNSFHGS
jgi:hypothetical protein